MLTLEIAGLEVYDEVNNLFVNTKPQTITLEHSLVSVSKWESKWCVPFLSTKEKTEEQNIDYIKCMTITQNVDVNLYNLISIEHIQKIGNYINSPMTATTIKNNNSKVNREIITSELIYYWMIALNIPFECQKWHLNRLLTLINVCSIKQQPPKKMSGRSLAKNNAALNAQRRMLMNNNG